MTAPITFQSVALGNRQLAMLGEQIVGEVADYPGGANVKAIWHCALFSSSARRPATSRAMARKLLLKRIAEWFDGTGRDDLAPLATEIRLQAERETVEQ